jgi:hypothetical protein
MYIRCSGISDVSETINESFVKLVLVECVGFATVRFDGESGLCTTEFGSSGATIDCLPIDGGSYAIFPPSVGSDVFGIKGCLRIDCDGTAVYYPSRWPGTVPAAESQPPYYILRHSDDVVIETVDNDGCHYFVTRTGDNHIGIADDSSIVVGSKDSGVSDDAALATQCETQQLTGEADDLERPMSPVNGTTASEEAVVESEEAQQTPGQCLLLVPI